MASQKEKKEGVKESQEERYDEPQSYQGCFRQMASKVHHRRDPGSRWLRPWAGLAAGSAHRLHLATLVSSPSRPWHGRTNRKTAPRRWGTTSYSASSDDWAAGDASTEALSASRQLTAALSASTADGVGWLSGRFGSWPSGETCPQPAAVVAQLAASGPGRKETRSCAGECSLDGLARSAGLWHPY